MSEASLARWTRLMRRLSLAENAEMYEALERAYSEPQRFYHNSEHISACLHHLDRCADALDEPAEVELALWFHDAVYDPHSSDNEARSADWARAFLLENGAAQELSQRVHQLIMATAGHALANMEDMRYLLDIDLAILGAPEYIFSEFERAIRREYAFVPEAVYRVKRVQVLEGFLSRSRIYQTEHFAGLEVRARINLAAVIAQLCD